MPRLPFDLAARTPYLEPPFPAAEYERRIDTLCAAMEAAGLDAVIVYGNPVSYASVTYLSALTPVYGNAYVVVHSDRRTIVVMDGMLHAEPMHSMVWTCRVADVRISLGPLYGEGPERSAALAADAAKGAKRVGIAGMALVPGLHLEALMAAHPDAAGVDAIVNRLRAVKSPAEIEKMRYAGHIADEAYAAIFETLTEGAEETAVAAAAVGRMRALGATEAFETSVVGGKRAGVKHGLPRRGRRLQGGEVVFLDLGARIDGYCSDVSRCTVVGEKASGRAADMLEAGLELYRAGLEALKPGNTVAEMAKRLQRVVTGTPWEPHFYPEGFGHGVGLDLFEAPGGLYAGCDVVFQPGMTLAYEPMLVVEGLGTAVVEDTLLVTEAGYEALSRYKAKTWS